MPTYRPGPQFYTSSPLGGSRVHKPVGSGVDWSQWFDHFWQAKGAASYAASLLDLVGAQNLVEGNGAVPWAAGAGWGFVAGQVKWLDTGLVPANTSYTLMVQFANLVQIHNTIIAGSFSTGRRFSITPFLQLPPRISYANGGFLNIPASVTSGNLCFSGNTAYRNGIAEAGNIPAGIVPVFSAYIGALNTGVAGNFSTSDIIALGIKKGPALTAPQVLAAATEMALI